MDSSIKIRFWNIIGAASLFPLIYAMYWIIMSYFWGAVIWGDVTYYGFEAVKNTASTMNAFLWKLYLICAAGILSAGFNVARIKEEEKIKLKVVVEEINNSSLLGGE